MVSTIDTITKCISMKFRWGLAIEDPQNEFFCGVRTPPPHESRPYDTEVKITIEIPSFATAAIPENPILLYDYSEYTYLT